jgi:hypothetical protein
VSLRRVLGRYNSSHFSNQIFASCGPQGLILAPWLLILPPWLLRSRCEWSPFVDFGFMGGKSGSVLRNLVA